MTPDQSEFTFWPDPTEAAYIASHSAKDIGMIMHDYPDLFVAFIHELWRTDQVEKMFESVKSLRKKYDVHPVTLLQENGPELIASMCLVYGVPIDEASKFLKDALEVTYKVENDIGFQDPLPAQIKGVLDSGIDFFMIPIKERSDKIVRH